MSAEPLDVGLKIRIVPKNRVLDDDIASLANDENWLVARVIEGGGTTPDEFIVSTQDKQSFVHWISDPKINVVYLLATGPRRAALADVVRGAFEAYSVPEVIEMAHAATDRVSSMRAIYYLRFWHQMNSTIQFSKSSNRTLLRMIRRFAAPQCWRCPISAGGDSRRS